MFLVYAVARAATQDSTIVGVATPAELSALYRDLMSPYCPGLNLASCPSPQADSLRKAIAARYENGESPSDITTSLVEHYGAGIRGSPSLDGFGAMAFVAPVVLLIGGALLAQRWLRRNVRKSQLPLALMCILPLAGCGDAAQSRPDQAPPRIARTETPTVPWVSDEWMRAGDAGATTGAYAVIHNPRSDALQIVGVTSVVADTVEIHETTQHDGMVHMTPQASLTIAAEDSVVLKPGGKHFMVRALKRSLTPGETVTLRIYFSDRTSLDVLCDVRPIGG